MSVPSKKTYAVQPSSGLAQVRIFNTVNCPASVVIDNQKFILQSLDMYQNLSVPVQGKTKLKFNAEYINCLHNPSPG